MKFLIQIDRQLFRWTYQRPYKDSFFIKVLIFMGDAPFWMIIVFIIALAGQLLHSNSLSQLSILLMFALIISNIVISQLKKYVKRKRPYANKELHQNLNIHIENRDTGHGSKELESFPSGHVLWTTLCVSLICYQYGYIAVLLLGWMIPTMIYLRPHLGVHYPSDVLGGFLLGATNVAITILVAPALLELFHGFNDHAAYLYGYWAFIGVFLILGFKSWLKRV